MKKSPKDLYGEYIFTSFPLTDSYRGETHLECLFEQCQLFYGVNDPRAIFDDIQIHLQNLTPPLRVRINLVPASRESINVDTYSVDMLNFEIKTETLTLSQTPVALKTSLGFRNPQLEKIKIANYVGGFHLKRLARLEGFDDILYVSPNNEVLETTTSNIFCSIGGDWYTPARYIYCGVTRAELIQELAAKPKIISLGDLLNADSVFICNSFGRRRSVIRINDIGFNKGQL